MYSHAADIFLTAIFLIVKDVGSTASDTHIVTFFSPPTLDVPDTIDIPSGSSLVMKCTGMYELEWKLPTLNINSLQYRYNITETINETNRGLKLYESILTVSQLTSNDTGLYSCYYEESENVTIEDDHFASAYVFVNDPNQLILPQPRGVYFDILPVHHGRKTILHCPSTYSSINVTLCKVFEYECEPIPYGVEIEYDATKGFIIPFPMSYFSGSFTCIAHLGNFTQEMHLVLAYFEETTSPQLFITSSRNISYFMVNSTFSLNCTIEVKSGTLVHVKWGYPGQMTNATHIIEKDSIISTETASTFTYRKVTKELLITDAQLSDAGKYRCTVVDHGNKSNSEVIDIKIYEWSRTPYINLTTEINTAEPSESLIGGEFRILISIAVFPYSNSISTIWMKDGNQLIDEHYEIESSLTRSSLVIKQLRRQDSGKYTLIVKSGNTANNISITLHVIDKPHINVSGNQDVYMLKKTYVLFCNGTGYPNPVAWWKWKKIASPHNKSNDIYSWKEAEESEHQPNVINETKWTADGIAVAYLEVSAIESGFYTCSSSNRIGYANETLLFFVTDAENGFESSVTNENPIEGDKVSITCKASSYHYRKISWRWNPLVNSSIIQARAGISDLQLPVNKTKYSLTIVKEFPAIKLQDSGIYECQALRNDVNHNHQKNITLKVRDIRKPRFNSTNMSGSKITVPLEVEFAFKCYVEGVPFPEILWYKDKEIFDVSNKSGIELVHNSQKLIINRVIENDEGFYSCKAKNRGGTISANLTLYVFKVSPLKTKKITTTETSVIVVIVVIALLLLSLSIILVKRVYKERKEKQEIEFFSQALFKHGQVEMYNPDLPLTDQVELLPYDNRWEFPKERLKLGKTLGQGAFGRVVKAEAIGIEDGEISTTVAVKMLKERVDIHQRKALMTELKILIHLGRHLNIVNLLGAVTKNMTKGELMVIVEYCPYGNLRHYLLHKRPTFINQLDPSNGRVDPCICTLPGSPGIENIEKVAAAYDSAFASGIINPNYRSQFIHYADLLHRKRSTSTSDSSSKMTGRTTTTQLSVDREYFSNDDPVQSDSYSKSSSPTVKDQPVTTCDLLCFAFQCARGMEYLTSRKLIHRDLAARNVLLAENNVVKICDFGLAKDCYKYSKYVKKGDGPLPVKWMAIESIRDKVFTSKSDVWSFGILLWEFFTLGGNPYPGIDINEGFYRMLKDGFRMEKPDYAPTSVYETMERCWKSEPNDRPDFTTLAENLGELLQESVRKYYIELNEPYLTMNAELLNNNDYLQMGIEEKTHYMNVNVESPPESLKNQTSSPYDIVGVVRPVDNGPVPKAPMEVVPMIQLEPVKKKGSKHTVPAPIPDLLTISPSFDQPNDANYLHMLSPKNFNNKAKQKDCEKELKPVTLNVASLVTS